MKQAVIVCGVVLLAATCQAGVIIVDDNWPADFNNIQAAINASTTGDTVEVKPGIYTGQGQTGF